MASSDRAADVLIVGEVLIDRVELNDGTVREHPGGSPANVAVTLGRLGSSPRLLTDYAPDPRGAVIESWLRDSGVRLVPGSASGAKTSVASSTLGPDGSATYTFDIRWDPRRPHMIGRPAVVHVGSFSTLLSPGASTVHSLVEQARHTATITYDPNLRPSLCPDRTSVRAQVERLVALADVVKVSDEDLAWLYPDSEPRDVLTHWAHLDEPRVVVGTFGAEGALAVLPDTETRCAAPVTVVADTIGAGDSFMGALIHGLIQHDLVGAHRREQLHTVKAETMSAILQTCVDVAAITVSRPGADPPWSHELP
jgi:fructokinase